MRPTATKRSTVRNLRPRVEKARSVAGGCSNNLSIESLLSSAMESISDDATKDLRGTTPSPKPKRSA